MKAQDLEVTMGALRAMEAAHGLLADAALAAGAQIDYARNYAAAHAYEYARHLVERVRGRAAAEPTTERATNET